jgi:hypothetical protein
LTHSRAADDTEVLSFINNTLDVVKKVQHTLLVLLATENYFDHLELIEEFQIFKDFLESICSIVKMVQAIDLRSGASLWLFIKKLVLKNEAFIKKEDTGWLRKVVGNICRAVRSIGELSENELKFRSFLVDILMSMVKTFGKDGRFVGHDELVESMIEIGRFMYLNEESKVVSHMHVGFMSILGTIYSDPLFAEVCV